MGQQQPLFQKVRWKCHILITKTKKVLTRSTREMSREMYAAKAVMDMLHLVHFFLLPQFIQPFDISHTSPLCEGNDLFEIWILNQSKRTYKPFESYTAPGEMKYKKERHIKSHDTCGTAWTFLTKQVQLSWTLTLMLKTLVVYDACMVKCVII